MGKEGREDKLWKVGGCGWSGDLGISSESEALAPPRKNFRLVDGGALLVGLPAGVCCGVRFGKPVAGVVMMGFSAFGEAGSGGGPEAALTRGGGPKAGEQKGTLGGG